MRRLSESELVALVRLHTGTTPAQFAEMTDAEFNITADDADEPDTAIPAWPYWAKVKFLLLATQYPNPTQPH